MERVTLKESDGRGTNTWERGNGGHMWLDNIFKSNLISYPFVEF
jgi:hypothetical protein